MPKKIVAVVVMLLHALFISNRDVGKSRLPGNFTVEGDLVVR